MKPKKFVVGAAIAGIAAVLAGMGGAQSGGHYDQVNVSYNRPLLRKNESVIAAGVMVVSLPSGEYVINRNDIISVNTSTYEIQGGMRVWEVLVTERSSHMVRFYYSRPIQVKEEREGDNGDGGKLKDVKSPKGDGPQTQEEVRKEETDKESKLEVPIRREYPATTHAHITEYRLGSQRQAEELYAWFTLHVWGWSPEAERPEKARDFEWLKVQPVFKDWNNEQDD
jgi:hypothetical protein